jgi:predicted NBD/HSP70 family sugar kinase
MYAEIAGNKQTHFMDLLDQWQTESIDLSLQLELMGKYLGIAIASATNLLNPAFVVVSGPLLDARDVLRHSLESEFSQRVCASLECPLMFAAADHNDPFHAGVAVYRNWQSQQPPHVIHN